MVGDGGETQRILQALVGYQLISQNKMADGTVTFSVTPLGSKFLEFMKEKIWLPPPRGTGTPPPESVTNLHAAHIRLHSPLSASLWPSGSCAACRSRRRVLSASMPAKWQHTAKGSSAGAPSIQARISWVSRRLSKFVSGVGENGGGKAIHLPRSLAREYCGGFFGGAGRKTVQNADNRG